MNISGSPHLSLSEVMAWCHGKADSLGRVGFVCEVKENLECDNRSVTMTVDGKNIIAELVIWSGGRIYSEALSPHTGARQYLKDTDVEDMNSLEAEAADFFRLFL
ncbi:hypothetical protein [Niveispirillum sp. KHB5.9]|uniref:hypothetical protein n=1 Tax=Niveispirillum sp. KHB5.9 TaxID=3400269 RepID=UPI003A882797